MTSALAKPMTPEPCTITALSASALSKAIHSKIYSCVEVMQVHLKRIDAVNPRFIAIVSLRDRDVLIQEAKAHDDLLAAGKSKGWLHGIPQAIKDLAITKDVPTVMGSPLLIKNQPTDDALVVKRMKAAGAIVIGKANVPEFGLGSHTFNPVFGATGNAYDPSKTAGGSSGGTAVAVATHMLAVADGSDFMGSLRNPAGWNNIIGLRPSQGRVPMQPATEVWINQLATEGPMGRTVEDVARLLAIQSGYDARSPLSLKQAFDLEAALTPMLDSETKNIRIGWLGDLNGYLPCEAGVLDLCRNPLQAIQHKGCKVDSLTSHAQLGFEPSRVWDAWLVWRAMLVASRLSGLLALPNAREQMKPEALWEIDSAKTVSGVQFNQAAAVRSSFYAAMLKLFETYDVLALPSAQVFPFDVAMRYPTEIITARGAVQMDTYHRWMESSIYATFAGLPAISLPAGFNQQGLPMGLQLIGKPQGDEQLLRIAALFTP